MPIECAWLRSDKPKFDNCPKCKERFEPFLRGMIQSFWRGLFGKPYCAVICRACKDIVGWEK